MSEYRDRLFGFLAGHAPGARDDLFAGEVGVPPSSVPTDADGLIARFCREFATVGGESIDLSGEDEPREVLRAWLSSVGPGPAAIDADPAWERLGIPVRELIREVGMDVQEVGGQTSSRDLADTELGLTIADVAIAETGSIGQCARPFRPRSLSLVPPRHLVFVPRDRLVAGLEDFFAGVMSGGPAWAGGTARFTAYFTWITGPSRTADIEKTLTIGIHGPGRLGVVFLPDRVDT